MYYNQKYYKNKVKKENCQIKVIWKNKNFLFKKLIIKINNIKGAKGELADKGKLN